ncbi:MAG TPA: PLP-dependent aspartate aminotransferase family protein [Roseiarcus sp.]|nr:PLP-dependent aspartate aminotransferase family protein [Roseiarcus sp.]
MDQGKSDWRPATLAAQALGKIDEATRAVVPPLHMTSTFIRDPDNLYRSGNKYGRPDNETVRHGEAIIAALEGGQAALLFGSGTSAAVALFLGLGHGAHVIAPRAMYWSLRNWLVNEGPAFGLSVDLVAADDLEAIAAAVQPGRTELIFLETPSNPLWLISDIAGAAAIAHRAGAKLAVDSTCATPLLTQPLALGADVVMHSATKYLNGHSDVIAGALVFAAEDELAQRIRQIRTAHGLILGPFEAFLLIRGMRTLDLRVNAACKSALDLAERLSNHAGVASVLYPGLPTHPGHDLARRQMRGGFGGMLSIRARGGEKAAIAAAARVKLWKRATSLGGVESLIEHRATIEGPGSPCPPDLLRLSVGVEDVEDLWRDLDQALGN